MRNGETSSMTQTQSLGGSVRRWNSDPLPQVNPRLSLTTKPSKTQQTPHKITILPFPPLPLFWTKTNPLSLLFPLTVFWLAPHPNPPAFYGRDHTRPSLWTLRRLRSGSNRLQSRVWPDPFFFYWWWWWGKVQAHVPGQASDLEVPLPHYPSRPQSDVVSRVPRPPLQHEGLLRRRFVSILVLFSIVDFYFLFGCWGKANALFESYAVFGLLSEVWEVGTYIKNKHDLLILILKVFFCFWVWIKCKALFGCWEKEMLVSGVLKLFYGSEQLRLTLQWKSFNFELFSGIFLVTKHGVYRELGLTAWDFAPWYML